MLQGSSVWRAFYNNAFFVFCFGSSLILPRYQVFNFVDDI
jgi:hypothetical protein